MTPSLPLIQGRYAFDLPLAPSTWFRVGGPARVVFKPKNTDDLQNFLKNKPTDLPILCIGAGSNVLVRDGGINACVVRLGSGFSQIEKENNTVIVGAGCLDRTVALQCQQWGLTGLEFLVGIPGAIGGAVAMNAGAYGGEVKDFMAWVEVVDERGTLHRLTPSDLNMTYRTGNLPKGCIAIRAAFVCEPNDPAKIQDTLNDFLKRREDTQPVRGRTGGSTFKNPPEQKAWELIDIAGCRGLQIGDAQVSEKHCNFLLNLGTATAHHIETLGETVRQRVLEKTGVTLKWEIIRLGLTVSADN